MGTTNSVLGEEGQILTIEQQILATLQTISNNILLLQPQYQTIEQGLTNISNLLQTLPVSVVTQETVPEVQNYLKDIEAGLGIPETTPAPTPAPTPEVTPAPTPVPTA